MKQKINYMYFKNIFSYQLILQFLDKEKQY